MVERILNVTLDGVTDAQRLPGSSSIAWNPSGSRTSIDFYSVYVTAPDTLDATVNFTGENWRISNFQVAGDDAITRLIDLDDGAGREIEYLNLGYNSVVNLTSTKVRYMSGWEGEMHDITLGPQNAWMHWANLGALVNKLDTAVGWIGGIDVYRGRADFIVRGGVGTIDLGEQNDRLVVDGGRVFSASMQSGDDIVIVRNGGRINLLEAFDGSDRVTVNDGARVDSFRGGNGETSLTFNGSGRSETLTIFDSALTLKSADGYIRSIGGHNVSSDILIGAGGSGGIKFTAGAVQSHKIVLNGYVDSVVTSDSANSDQDDQTTALTINSYGGAVLLGSGNDFVKTGNFFVSSISTSRGNDVVRIGDGGGDLVSTGDGNDKVFTADGFVAHIRTGNGNDTVTMGGAGGASVSLGDGNDVIIVQEIDPELAVTVHGYRGVDTIDFRGFTVGVTFSLKEVGTLQDVAGGKTPADATTEPSVKGYFAQTGMDNIFGANKADVLTGNGLDNRLFGRAGNDVLNGEGGKDVLNGAAGNDRLFGGAGADTLIGGKGRDFLEGGIGDDVLRGQAGRDVFKFGANSGTDTVKDYADGVDTLRIADHSGGFGGLAISVADGNKVIEHDGGTIILEGRAGVTLTAADFDFV